MDYKIDEISFIILKLKMSGGTSKLSIPTGLQILLSDLDFLGQISRGQKACVTSRVIVDGSTWVGAFYRAWKGENRINTINKIEQIINQTIDAIDSHKNTEYLEIVVNSFAYARNGVDALGATYENDPDMRARINVQLKNIDLQLNQYRHLIKGYSNDTPKSTSSNNPLITGPSVINGSGNNVLSTNVPSTNNGTIMSEQEKMERQRRRRPKPEGGIGESQDQ